LQHAIAARRIATRIAAVREAVGLAAYAAGDWATAIAELRTYHRMSGKQTHLAEIADCERALGRPERAIDLFRGADRDALDKAEAIELLIVTAGARGDLGQHDAAVAMLQVRELTADEDADWAARLRYAYADALLAAGRREEAREWFARAAATDTDGLTDAAERLLELDGVTIEGDDEDEDEATAEAVADDDAEDGDGEPADRLDADEDLDDEQDEDLDGDERDEAQFRSDAFEEEAEDDADLEDGIAADAVVEAGSVAELEDDLGTDAVIEAGSDADERPGAAFDTERDADGPADAALERDADVRGDDVEQKASGDEFVVAAEDERDDRRPEA
jgi:tetratricopeptide (TPR) repeat protein